MRAAPHQTTGHRLQAACRNALLLGAIAGAVLPAGMAAAQFAQPAAIATPPKTPKAADSAPAKSAAMSKRDPVTFTADAVSYDRDRGIVTATGHVEAWQNDHQLRADTVTYDRNTDVTAARGHVQLIDPNGQVVFADYAELTSGMKDGVLRGMRAILAANGKLAANGARRTNGQINELSRVVYSTCNLCVKHPDAPPLWQLRARTAVQDLVNKRIEYQDAYLDVFGLPIFYFPYFSHADPSVKRSSGFLVPSIGSSTHLGQFAQVPYYWVLGPSSDLTIVPLVATLTGPQLDFTYRRALNFGSITTNASAAYDQGHFQGHLYADGKFTYNDTWRYGFDINLATSIDYLRDYRIAQLAGNVLNTQLFIEGFGQGSYSKLSALSYQGLNSTVTNSALPFVLPRYQYSYFGLKDGWGGRLSFDTDDFNVVRRIGTNDQRAGVILNWERPGIGALGDVWSFTARLEAAAYSAFDLNQQPNYASIDNTTTARLQPTAALKVSWPLLRILPRGGSLIVEPIAQFILSPNTGSSTYSKVPNEDSLVPEFTDTELFSINRFQGLDRQEGGIRANLGMHLNLTTPALGSFDGLIGQSYRLHADDTFPAYVGLDKYVSDLVGRITYTPSSFLDLTARTRVDHQNFDVHYGELVGSIGPRLLRLSTGYIYSANTPYFFNERPPQGDALLPRNEVQVSAASNFGHWRIGASARRDLQNGKMVDAGVDGAYENECFIFDLKFARRYTVIDGDSGDSTILVQITLKTVGEFGVHAL